MGRLRRLRTYRPGDYLLAARVLALVVAVRVALSLLPYGFVERLLAVQVRSRQTSGVEVSRLLRMVQAVTARVLPRKPCLTQALVARRLLAQRGVDATLRIGVARPDRRALHAHAWLEQDGRIVLGGARSRGRYKVLEPL